MRHASCPVSVTAPAHSDFAAAGLQVGNAVTEGREVVIGLGSMQVINAALFAFSGRMLDGSDPPAGKPRLQPRLLVPPSQPAVLPH